MPEAFLPEQTTFAARDVAMALSQGPEGQSLLEAWRAERRVPANIRDAFLEEVATRVRAGADVRRAIRKSIRDDHLMRVGVPDGTLPNSLSNVSSAYGLLRDAERAGRLPTGLSVADAEPFHELVRRSPVAAASVVPQVLREGQPLVWWTNSRELEGLEPNEIRNRLGLSGDRYAPCAYLIEAELKRADVSPCAVPTVLDAGDNPAFRPVGPNENAGRTAPLDGGNDGLPEWVSKPVSTQRATWRARGHVDRRVEESPR
jgi:hypothetical protein